MPREAARKVITDAMVQKVKPAPEGKRTEYWDAIVPGFGLRVTDARGKSFFLRTRSGSGQLRMSWPYPATSLEAARAAAKAALADIERGIDPKAKKATETEAKAEKAANTFKTVGERFMRQHVEPRLALSTHREYRRALFGSDTAAWADKPVDSITRADVRAVLDTMVERGSAGGANNLLAHLSKFFNWCAEQDLLEIPPTDRLKPPGQKNVGERTLTEAEIAEVWQAFGTEGGAFCDLFKLLLLTGQRRGEVGGMRWSELVGLDGDRPAWEIPSDRTKNGRPHTVPLAPLAAAIAKGRPEIGDTGFLFTNTGKTPVSGFSKTKERVDGRIARRREKAGLPPMPEWTLHDLRRTMVTMMNERLAIAPHVVEACVNHVSGSAKAGVAGVYNKAMYLEDRRRAFEAWAGYVEKIVKEGVPEGETGSSAAPATATNPQAGRRINPRST
ncbi:tyrosine-type recombinase/integrase [Magnetospirillum fulvum]|uniref:Site-specific recombinase XerD n=1 Tax=Magnetospirillum fulvum TaxID=1082 RepID=A0A1H6HB58_MAGFU|nr:site-specific integrase [Magnetospirillum fulvum]SEH31203.1 Site-specific recombinase XerD [Magnetospirillum fulvum]